MSCGYCDKFVAHSPDHEYCEEYWWLGECAGFLWYSKYSDKWYLHAGPKGRYTNVHVTHCPWCGSKLNGVETEGYSQW